jgi:LPS export ABC transporter protein LptC
MAAAARIAASALLGATVAVLGATVAVLGATVAVLGATVAVLGACSLDYNPARLEEEIAAEIPDSVLVDFRHTIVSGDRVWVILEARRAETYGKRDEIVLEGVRFREYNPEGELVSEAYADRAVFNTESEDATAAGSIRIRSPKDEASLFADSLVWSREGKQLQAEAEARVRLEKEDGSYLEGQGFSADFRRRRLRFERGAAGRYVWEEDEEQ